MLTQELEEILSNMEHLIVYTNEDESIGVLRPPSKSNISRVFDISNTTGCSENEMDILDEFIISAVNEYEYEDMEIVVGNNSLNDGDSDEED